MKDKAGVPADISVEYVDEVIADEELPSEFADVFKKFQESEAGAEAEGEVEGAEVKVEKDGDINMEDGGEKGGKGEEVAEEDENKVKKPTKKQRKELKRLRVAVLKQIVDRPEVVEVHDVNAADPEFLITLKTHRNTVPVPRHWCQKRKYLQNKRGTEKVMFELPDFIKDTGIQRIRDAYREKEDAKKLKQKGRERMQPKTGKMDIDYQVGVTQSYRLDKIYDGRNICIL